MYLKDLRQKLNCPRNLLAELECGTNDLMIPRLTNQAKINLVPLTTSTEFLIVKQFRLIEKCTTNISLNRTPFILNCSNVVFSSEMMQFNRNVCSQIRCYYEY